MFKNKNAAKPGVGRQVRIRLPESRIGVLEETSPEERGDAIFMHEDLVKLAESCAKMLSKTNMPMWAEVVEKDLDRILNLQK